MRAWVPTVAVSALWLLSHLTPWSHQSDTSSLSAWRVYSEHGRVGWASVQLSGPDPAERLDTSAPEELRDLLARNSAQWWHVQSSSQGESSRPGADLDSIEWRQAQVAWILLAILTALQALWSLLSRRKGGAAAG